MFYQNEPGLADYIQHYGCLTLDLALAREKITGQLWTKDEFNQLWKDAIAAGIISGDLNCDGDLNDDGEAILQRWDAFCIMGNIPLRALRTDEIKWPMGKDENGVPRILPTAVSFDPTRYWVAERWKYKISHFVKGDGTGLLKPEYDSIRYGSLTRQKGKIMDLRVLAIVR